MAEQKRDAKKGGESATGASLGGRWAWRRFAGQQGKPCWRACGKMTATRCGGREAANW